MEQIIIPTPTWQSQPFYPILLEISINRPLLLTPLSDLLFDPPGRKQLLVQNGNISDSKISDIVLVSNKEFLDIHGTKECRFTLKRVRDMILTNSGNIRLPAWKVIGNLFKWKEYEIMHSNLFPTHNDRILLETTNWPGVRN